MRNYLTEKHIRAFVKVYPSEDIFQGMETLIRGYGFGPLEPNTIFLGDVQRDDHLMLYIRLLKMIRDNKRNLIVLREGQGRRPCPERDELTCGGGGKAGILALYWLSRTSSG
jgi:hypothetical protein